MADDFTPIEDEYTKRLRALQAQQAAANAAAAQQETTYGQQRVNNYAGVTGGTGDLDRQGFGGMSPQLAAQQQLNQQGIADQNIRQQQLSSSLSAYGAGHLSDRLAAASPTSDYWRYQTALEQMAAAAAGGGGGAGGGAGGGVTMTEGQAGEMARLAMIAEFNEPGGDSHRSRLMRNVRTPWGKRALTEAMNMPNTKRPRVGVGSVRKPGLNNDNYFPLGLTQPGAVTQRLRELYAEAQDGGLITGMSQKGLNALIKQYLKAADIRAKEQYMRRYLQTKLGLLAP